MKRIDKLIFGSFIGPFLLTLVVVDFILLLVTLLKYFDEIMGKGLGFEVFAELIFYFSVTSSPDAFPLAVLLSSIMTFGNLGEHSELVAVKSSGISLLRALVPIFIFVLFLTGFTYYSNTQLVPKTNLKTYSLLWDIRTKKPALDIKEGVFYKGIPNYTIKVNEKVGDEKLKDVIIYDHTEAKAAGNKIVIVADSGRMYSFMNQRYLALELFSGTTYREQMEETYRSKAKGGQFTRDSFSRSKIVFDLSSFDLNKTDERLFRRSRLVQTRQSLIYGVDSMWRDELIQKERLFRELGNTFEYHFVRSFNMIPEELTEERVFYDSLRSSRKKLQAARNNLDMPDSLEDKPAMEIAKNEGNALKSVTSVIPDPVQNPYDNNDSSGNQVTKALSKFSGKGFGEVRVKEVNSKDSERSWKKFDSHFKRNRNLTNALIYAQNKTRSARNLINTRSDNLRSVKRERDKYLVTKNQQMARSLSCLIMFLIGAPIGAIIKKGGIGLPVVVSILFFLIFYILNTAGGKWGSAGVMHPAIAVWISNAALLPIGLFFLSKARKDARLFETDAYIMLWDKVKRRFQKKPALEAS